MRFIKKYIFRFQKPDDKKQLRINKLGGFDGPQAPKNLMVILSTSLEVSLKSH